ncbi:MAG TPA: tetratricopeptide repeat protein [Thermodesulfobacteriota bacterium]|nr:tetratricopeptide repeat protein [Thermodesulfobacteriota bacterium]
MNEVNRIVKFKAAVEKNPDNPLARYSLANECYKLGLYHEAIAEIGEYLKIAEDQGAVYRMLAECYLNVGDSEMAREAYFKGIEAATKHGHPGMAEEFEEAIDMIED